MLNSFCHEVSFSPTNPGRWAGTQFAAVRKFASLLGPKLYIPLVKYDSHANAHAGYASLEGGDF